MRERTRRNPGWKYGLTEREYKAMLFRQNGHCLFCDSTDLEIDHEHVRMGWTMKELVRGLLCHRHNMVVGFIENHREELPAILAYIDRDVYHHASSS